VIAPAVQDEGGGRTALCVLDSDGGTVAVPVNDRPVDVEFVDKTFEVGDVPVE
jgi:hypothetical protein